MNYRRGNSIIEILRSLMRLSTTKNHRILELIAADQYRQGRIGAAEVRRMLSFSSRWETYQFLKREKADLPYTEEDLDQDIQSIQNTLTRT
jgi:predicted HTH domain antitoxin